MAATFDLTLPTAKDRLRRLLGDADVADPLRQDEEYVAALSLYDEDEAFAGAYLAEGLAAEFGRRPDSISDEGTTIRWGERVKTWLELAKRLLAEGSAGISVATLITVERADAIEQSEHWRPYWWTG